MAVLMTDRVMVSEPPELVDELSQKGLGERQGTTLLLAPEEALYLKEKRKEFNIENSKGKSQGYDDLLKTFMKTDKNFGNKYIVFRDLKDRGFVAKTGFKYGSDYRIYSRGDKPGKGHAIWLVQVRPEESKCDFSLVSRSVRLAQNVRKKMIYALLDKEGDISYYKFEWFKP
ncbi:MAG: tRNA-intron lyase [DPANN group archaeon]|nr:tRNA-intron lyase [DPANN group archaeon]